MRNTKETFALGFGIFAAFFGAGNLILPPLLGFKSCPDWWLVAIGFILSATVIPFFALLFSLWGDLTDSPSTRIFTYKLRQFIVLHAAY